MHRAEHAKRAQGYAAGLHSSQVAHVCATLERLHGSSWAVQAAASPPFLLQGPEPQTSAQLAQLIWRCSLCPRPAGEFEGSKKSCRRKLKRHNERRRVEYSRDAGEDSDFEVRRCCCC